MTEMRKTLITLIIMTGLLPALASARERAQAPAAERLTAAELEATLAEMDLPALYFNMKNGEDPDFDLLFPPEGCGGASITNNEYVEGALTISRLGETYYESGEYVKKESGVRLKVRGNTSANWDGKKSSKPGYKIKLSKKANILDCWPDAPKSKDWVLVTANNTDLNIQAGFELGRICGLGWQPRGVYVNVVLNGKYRGVYFLCEAVSGEEGRAAIEDSGYIIEDDPYWWKPDEVYFKSRHIPASLGWTFKEPDTDDFEENTLSNIQWAVSILEDALYNDKPTDALIDFRSFACWVLAHDIMNTIDPAGSNIFLIKDSFSHLTPFETPFRMGPLWDLDTSFSRKSEEFSPVHGSDVYYFRELFRIPEFQQEYKEQWNSIAPTLAATFMERVKSQLALNEGLDDARALENRLKGRGYTEKEICLKNLEEWIAGRVKTLDRLINGGSGIDEVETDRDTDGYGYGAGLAEGHATYTVGGVRVSGNDTAKGILVSSDGRRILRRGE